MPTKDTTVKLGDGDKVTKESEEDLDTKSADPEISKSLTVAVKIITHRGTQTVIQCNPSVSPDDFIDIIMKTKV